MDIKPNHSYPNGEKIFFTSDTHFFHKNIIEYCNRPFGSVEEMNATLIQRWNDTVPTDGLVFHLGDFAFGSFRKWKEILDSLNGNIILIKGNHDIQNISSDKKYEELFTFSTWQMLVSIEGRSIYLNHCPFLCYGGTYRGKENAVYNLHGHVHTSPLYQGGKDNERMKYAFPTQYDVGVDNNNFTPISWHDVNIKIQEQIDAIH